MEKENGKTCAKEILLTVLLSLQNRNGVYKKVWMNFYNNPSITFSSLMPSASAL